MNELDALLKAVEILDGQVGMANELSRRMKLPVKQSHVYNWINRGKRLPEKYAHHVEAATKERGKPVLASALCPVAFPKTVT